MVKTILHARDPLFGGGVRQETMGLYRQVGGRARDHGSVQTGGEDGQETMGLYRQVGGGDGQETMGMYRQVGGGWIRDHGSVQTGGGGGDG